MAISTTERLAGPFVGDGATRTFSFAFPVLQVSDVTVSTSPDGLSDTTLPASAYTVTMNDDQDNNPGGIVVLESPLPSGNRLSITTDAPYIQPMVLTNRGGFYPDVLNQSADRHVIYIQQLAHRLGRAIKVPVTSSQTPEELATHLIETREVIDQKASEAASSASSAKQAEKASQSNANAAKKSAEAAAGSAESAANAAGTWTNAEQLAQRIETISTNLKNLTADAETVSPFTPASAQYSAAQNKLHFEIPRGQTGMTGDSIVDAFVEDGDLFVVIEDPAGEGTADDFVSTYRAHRS